LQERCVAYATNRTAELPVRKPKKATPEKRAQMLVVIDRGQVLLEQRPGTGIWGGLLSLPEVDGHVALDEDPEELGTSAASEAAEKFGAVEETESLLPLEHGFTHYKLHIHPYRITLKSRGDTPAGYVWWDLARIEDAALPSPIKKLLGLLGQPSLFA
jgi:A/G-specific adenine glycosylase